MTPGTAGTVASPNTRDVHSCHVMSFFGTAIGGGPSGALEVVAAPCGRAPESVT
ncbi:Uncharacterised protein [Mycobacteroides abscessus subsp. abscessus]|nr:Uncharacterised protein [Mycobacteroides abscessus subsp. abscessus]